MMTDNETAAAAKPCGSHAKPTATASSAPAAPSKAATVIKLLLRAKGATPMELIAATDWQPHSLRAFLSGLRKKGRAIAREARKSGEFAYRIVPPSTPAAETTTDIGSRAETGVAPSNSTGA